MGVGENIMAITTIILFMRKICTQQSLHFAGFHEPTNDKLLLSILLDYNYWSYKWKLIIVTWYGTLVDILEIVAEHYFALRFHTVLHYLLATSRRLGKVL